MSSSVSSSSSSPKLDFILENACGKEPSRYCISHGDRIAELKDATEEQILQVSVYRQPMNDSKPVDIFMYHAFVVFNSNNWWWSVENVTVQRSKEVLYVRNKFNGTDRSRVELAHGAWGRALSAAGKGTVADLVDFLWKRDHVHNPYDLPFARDVFNETNSENWTITAGLGILNHDLR